MCMCKCIVFECFNKKKMLKYAYVSCDCIREFKCMRFVCIGYMYFFLFNLFLHSMDLLHVRPYENS